MPASGPLGPIRWCTDTVPFTRQPMRDFADPAISVVVLMVAAQSAKTETIFNVLNWHYRTRPKPALYIAPTEKLCRTLSRDRLDEMLRSNSDLWPLVDKRFAKAGSMERWINGARLGMAWAGSAVEMVSHPCHTVMVDERGVMETVNTGAASDPVRDAQARTKNYKGSKVGVFSTPTDVDACPTFAWWRQGTRMRWSWYCPQCGTPFAPERAHLRYPQDAEYQTVRDEASIACPVCEHEIRDGERSTWNDDGSVTWHLEQGYVPSVIGEDGQIRLAPDLKTRNSVASYWVTGFCTPFASIGEIAEHLERSERDGQAGDQQSVVNQWCGELFEVVGDRPSWQQVLERTYSEIGDGQVQLVTVGVDVQRESLFYVVRGWGYLGESWLLGHEQLHGHTDFDEVWMALSAALDREFCGRRPDLVLVDSGYQAIRVYDKCRAQANWAACKGVATANEPYKRTLVDVSVTGRRQRTVPVWLCNADAWKVWLYGKIRAERDERGGWWVPHGIDEEYCQQVVNEKLVISDRGVRKWVRTGKRDNHYLDCEIYAAVAAHVRHVRTLKPVEKPADAPKVEATPVPARSSDPRMARRSL